MIAMNADVIRWEAILTKIYYFHIIRSQIISFNVTQNWINDVWDSWIAITLSSDKNIFMLT